MSHELFVDVTSTRPRTDSATGGTLAVSIAVHALLVAAVIILPLLAADALPMPAGAVPIFVRDAPPPLAAQLPAVTRTTSTTPPTARNVAPVEPPDAIVAEEPRATTVACTNCVVDPTAVSALIGEEGGTDSRVPQPPPPPPQPPQAPVRLSAYEMPRKVHDVAPRYPELAQRAGVDGVVIIEAVISVDGSVRDARVLRSVALLDRAALDAVKQWRYAPTRLNGVAVPVIVTVTVQFRLQR
jgi:protein TonB